MVEAISELARDAGVNVFRRFAFMKGLYQVEQVSFDRMVDPADDTDCTTATGPRIVWRGREARDRRRRQQGAVIGRRAFATITGKLSALSPQFSPGACR